MSILGVSGPTADGAARLRLEQRGRVERLNGLTSNLRVPTRPNVINRQLIQITRNPLNCSHNIASKVNPSHPPRRFKRDALLHNGCALAQGYLFARPVPATQFEQLLTADRSAPADRRTKARIETTSVV